MSQRHDHAIRRSPLDRARTEQAAYRPESLDRLVSGRISLEQYQKLRAAAAGNPAAEQAIDRLIASGQLTEAGLVALPAQPFQIPAQSDIGRGEGPGVYGSGIALGVDGFRIGFFGGPGTISPNQGGAKLEVLWINLANGRSGTESLYEHNDVPVDTTIRTRALDTGAGPVVAAVYGSLWHRWSVPVSDVNPDGYAYRLGTISVPSFGAVYN
ncbi:hypothetical protein [Nocardia abscessus]|uniref:hypothetical protein n=1 Tax=Nocardia abscessus TaxID=120957 RepID=UPI001D1492BE|nr:hypothetical protein [Nocardia abscessus]MCC3329425.1 hypothetical protein [Nocardia abscessus]